MKTLKVGDVSAQGDNFAGSRDTDLHGIWKMGSIDSDLDYVRPI